MLITPHAFVGVVDAFFTLGPRLDDRAVGIDDRTGEKLRGLLLPGLQPRHVEGLLQSPQIFALEAPAEVAGGGGIGNPLRAQQIEIGLVLTSQLEVLQARATAQRIVGQIEHVIRFVKRQVDFEQLQPRVDGFGQTQMADQLLHQADAAVSRAHTAPR
jgi:hypothetical protein